MRNKKSVLKPLSVSYDCSNGAVTGIAGNEGVVAIKTDRKYIGIELKESYFDLAVKNLRSAVESKKQLTIL